MEELFKVGSIVETFRDGRWVEAVVDDIAPNITGERAVYSLKLHNDHTVFYSCYADRIRKPQFDEPPEHHLQGLLLVYPGKPLDLADRTALRAVLDSVSSLTQRLATAEHKLNAIGKILDDHYDAECVNVEEGSWVGGYDPGAIEPIAEIVRPKGIQSYASVRKAQQS